MKVGDVRLRVGRFGEEVKIGTWTPKICKIISLLAVILGLGLLFYILLGLGTGLGLRVVLTIRFRT